MPSIIPTGFAEASVILTGGPGTAPYVTTIGIAVTVAAEDPYTLAADLVMDAYGDAFQDLVSNVCTIDRVSLAVGLPGGGSGSVDSTLPPKPGGNGDEMAPLAMAVIARKISADLGRKGKGRSFLPCMLARDDVNEAGDLAPATLNGYQERWEAFLLQLATNDVGLATAPVILHADGSTPSPIVAGTIAPKVGWIRKRIR
uniref:Uncharacterized protein n=1 Tax=uncultured prokaryote TaxID=198431 RepID=A0A0H5QLG8_9ZZZZ|nr:hypothetical protein [uncultured prokaryote]